VTTVERITQVEQGIPYGAFQQLAGRLGVSEERLRGVLSFSAATLHRRKVGRQVYAGRVQPPLLVGESARDGRAGARGF